MTKLTITRSDIPDISLEVSVGQNIYKILAAEGLMDGACGGVGRCGKCRIKAPGLPFLPAEEAFFSPEERSAGWRLACLHDIDTDTEIELPGEAAVSGITDSGYMKQVQIAPLWRLEYVDGQTVLLEENTPLSSWAGDTTDTFCGIAIDIGTTTVAAALVDMATGETMAKATCLNGQKTYGQDVITRIGYAMEEDNGLAKLHEAISKDICLLSAQLCQTARIGISRICAVTVAANNTMTHLLGNVDPSSLAAFPFLPAFTGALVFPAADLGLPIAENARVYCLPAVSSYVGGDITAGLLACEVKKQPGITLFIDIGTNGEIVLCNKGKMFSCSCAAGPALEGMDISCGMRAADGAIEDARFAGESLQLSTIGDIAPTGICGSGLLALISQFVQHGVIKPNGRIADHSLVEIYENKKRIAVDKEHRIYLSQNDIRQVQLAKGAILAGIRILLEQAKVGEDELDRVLVAGQFGAHLTAESLIGAGLIPGGLKDRISYVGNTSLSGAILCLLSAEEMKKAASLTDKMEYIELSVYPMYEKILASAMRF